MEFNLNEIILRIIIRFFTGLFAFGVVFLIDKIAKEDNEWDIKYVIVITSLFTTFLTILDVLGVF